MTSTLSPHFADPVRGAQGAFRAAMSALSRPGTVVRYQAPLAGAGALPANAYALALTLLDFEVRYHLSNSLESAAASVTFHTGAQRSGDCADVDFAFLDLALDRLDLAAFRQGVPDYPDRSTTIIALCDRLDHETPWAFRGPGISSVQALGVAPLPADFATQWSANAARSPLGVDVIFVSDQGFVGLPRSARIIGEGR